MNGYIAHYGGKKAEIYAPSLYEAKKKAMHELSVPLTKMGLLSVALAEVDGEPVIHDGASIAPY